MALSYSFDFTLNRNALITRALRMIGAIAANQEPTADEISDASEALNLMLKAWQADGLQLWTVTMTTFTPESGTYGYTVGPGADIDIPGNPIEIFEAYRRTTATTVDVPLNRLARTDYWELSDKDSEGTPVNFYFEPQKIFSNFYIWPTPDQNFINNNTIVILYQKPFDDMDSATDNLAFPQSWELAVVYGLAVLLAVEYGLPAGDINKLQELAFVEKERVLDWDTEHASVFLSPDPSAYC